MVIPVVKNLKEGYKKIEIFWPKSTVQSSQQKFVHLELNLPGQIQFEKV